MLEPSAIHSYEPPAYRNNPPSPSEGPPPSLPFHCAVLEAADSLGGPSPGLLHSLREQGCKLILAQVEDLEDLEERTEPPREREDARDSSPFRRNSRPRAYRPTSLNREWYDAVFDKVLSITGEEGRGISPLERFFADEGLPASQAVCFACTDAGAKAFGAVDAGLVLAPCHDKVWRREEEVVHLPGADVALSQSPTPRQLAWLHEVYTQKLWCCCMWLAPAVGELQHMKGLPSDGPSAYERATITSVASGTLQALGHPPWSPASKWEPWKENEEYPCMAQLGDELCACPDWTPLEPRFRSRGRSLKELVSLPEVAIYCHSLDVGLAKVHHLIEAQDVNGLAVRVSSNRLCSLCREGIAATEMSVTLVSCSHQNWPDICIRSSLLCENLPAGFKFYGKPTVDISKGTAMLQAAYQDENGQILLVRAWHRLCKDDGRGDVELSCNVGDTNSASSAQKATHYWGRPRENAAEVDIIFYNPRRGTRYTVEKVVSVIANSGRLKMSLGVSVPTNRFQKFLSRSDSTNETEGDGEDEPLTFPEIEEEHCSAWRAEWDKADIEIAGTRKASRFQRAVRLFRFHQVSRDDAVGIGGRKKPKVHPLVRALFKNLLTELCWEDSAGDRPSSIITSRVLVHDPRTPPVVRIEPKVPPDCHRMRFNAALGWRWHRFTLSPGKVQILVQGPILVSQVNNDDTQRSGTSAAQHVRSLLEAQLHGDTVNQPPKFIIPTNDGEEGVEVKAKPWHEVQVQYALTDLGRPDGSTGGFYGLMRRTRFIKLEVLRRLFAEDGEAFRPGLEDFRDETLSQPLTNALASLESAPRPPGWNLGDDADLHVLDADSTMRTRMLLQYEKNELKRDIVFLKGCFEQREGRLQMPGSGASEDLLVETMTVQEAMARCHTLRGCGGFCFQGDMTTSAVTIHFKGFGHEAVSAAVGWTSFYFEHGERALIKLLAQQYQARFCDPEKPCKSSWVEKEIPAWEVIVGRTLDVLRTTAAEGTPGRSKPFRNLITDRDGTTNNYCDRYASSVQSAYNAAWLSNFSRHCVDNAVFITAAPLGGRPSAEGLMELCVAPRGYFIYTGSKGREYYSDATQQLLEAEELPKEQRELVEELHRRILALCQQPGNTKFLGIGSGLQRKFGEVTMARNDPAGTVPEPESRRFMAAVRRVKEELDPDGTGLDLHDTGTDMEIFPRVMGGRPSFDKGDGVQRLDQKLGLHLSEGPNIVCGDTTSDLPMVLAVLRLMCGDKVVDRWQARLRQDDATDEPQEEDPSSDAELDEAAKEEAERKAREEEEEEKEARKVASKLAVLFVITPDSYNKSRRVADQVLKWCELSGAQCSIIPAPDVLVYTLAKYAEEKTGTSVTFHQIGDGDTTASDKDIDKDWTVPALGSRERSPSFELPEPNCVHGEVSELPLLPEAVLGASNGPRQAWAA